MHYLTLEFLVELPWFMWDVLLHEIKEHPAHVFFDILIVIIAIYALWVPVHKARKRDVEPPTKEEEEQLIAEFQSAPFEVPKRLELPPAPVVDKCVGAYAILEGDRRVLNAASFDFLVYATATCVVEAAQDAVIKYGCGSCGPRGFYGTIKPHLDVENRIARFLGTENCIIYSYSFATVSTLIPCFSGRGDELLVDKGCNLAVQIGARLSRSQTTYFRHNDLGHLEELMKLSVIRQAKQRGRLWRRTLIIEGVYRSSGEIAPLNRIVSLAKKYKYRVLLDDSLGFAALGVTGRGTPEHFSIPITDIDFYVGALSTSLGSVGGFCAGAAAMIDHQRLAATGYVFSASLPPYASVAAETVLDLIDEDPERVLQLQRNATVFRQLLGEKDVLPAGITVTGGDESKASPVICVTQKVAPQTQSEVDDARLRMFAVAEGMLQDGYMVAGIKSNDQELFPPPPSLRVTVKSEFTDHELRGLAESLKRHLTLHFH